ncbi:MAG TPA: ATP-binding protein [bacterium]|nr:ATP-binding protein [bacterium]HQO35073.1 ATP-binding protein [bacterium]HQP96811.1 ATP-binding protein [bacterium]
MYSKSLYFLTFVLLVVIGLLLLWAVRVHDEAIRQIPRILAREFPALVAREVPPALDGPGNTLHSLTTEIRQDYPFVQEIVVFKFREGYGPIAVYPAFFSQTHPDFLERHVEEYEAVPLRFLSMRVGTAYFRLDQTRRRLFNAALIGVLALLVGYSAVGVRILQKTSAQVVSKTIALEEKQRQLLHLERLSLVGQATAGLLHDLKKPLLNIRDEASGVENSDTRNAILAEVDLFLHILRGLQLEGFLNRSETKAEFLDLGEVIERSIRLVSYARNAVEVRRSMPENLPFLLGQFHQLVQVFSNILLNAFEALDGKGTVRIVARQDIFSHQGIETPMVEVVIADDGPGIPQELLDRIFEPFFSPGKGSTGLGLYTSKSIIDEMGGTIHAESELGKGTRFVVRLPIGEQEAPVEGG